MIVPILFETSTIEDDSPLFSWIFYMFVSKMSSNSNMVVIGQENFFKNLSKKKKNGMSLHLKELFDCTFPTTSLIKKCNKYMITNEELLSIVNEYEDSYESEKSLIVNFNQKLYSIIQDRIESIENDFEEHVDNIIVWVNNETINQYAKKHHINVINMELSSIRKNGYNMNLMYFCPDKYSVDYCKKMYYEFLKYDNIPILSRREILSLFISSDCLKSAFHYDSFSHFEIGISPGLKKDFFFDLYSNESIQSTFKKVKHFFNDSSVSIRFHPGYQWNLKKYNFIIDDSRNSVEWILKCKRIVTSVSNVGFEAMLLGRTVYILSDCMPYSFVANNCLDYIDDSIVDIRFINFMVFVFFVPLSLATDSQYILWRNTKPPILEIYLRHIKTIKKELGIKEKLTLNNILKKVHHLNQDAICKLCNDTDYNRYKMLLTNNVQLTQQCKELSNEISNVLNSRSWKITKPLRTISKKIKK